MKGKESRKWESQNARTASTAERFSSTHVWIGAAHPGMLSNSGQRCRFRTASDSRARWQRGKGPRCSFAKAHRVKVASTAGSRQNHPRSRSGSGTRASLASLCLRGKMAKRGSGVPLAVFVPISEIEHRSRADRQAIPIIPDAKPILRRHHIHENTIQKEVKKAVMACGFTKRVSLPHVPPQFRDAPPRSRLRHSHSPGIARPRRRQYNHDLYARPTARPRRCREPTRSIVTMSGRRKALPWAGLNVAAGFSLRRRSLFGFVAWTLVHTRVRVD